MSVRATWKRHGFIKAVFYTINRVLQRFVMLDITHVMIKDTEKLNSDGQPDDVECRFLTPDEVRDFASDPTNEIDAKLADRLTLGYDFCFGGIVDGKLASYCWLALDSIERDHNRANPSPKSGVAFSYPSDHAFRYKGFTHPDFRGRGLYQIVSGQASIAMSELGVRYVISTAEAVNYSAIKSSQRCNYKTIGYSFLIGIGGRVWVRTPDLRDRGILVGNDAVVLDRNSLPHDSSVTSESVAAHASELEPVAATN